MMRRRLLLLAQPPRWMHGVASISSSAKPDWRQVVADFQRQIGDANAPLLAQDVASAVVVCTANNRTHEALDIIRRADKRGVETPLWAHVQVCCAMARKGQADRALDRMKELREQFADHFQADSTVYDPLLSVLKAQGDLTRTHAAITQMNASGITPSLRAFRVLMLTAAKARRKDTLLTTLSFVQDKFPAVWKDVPTLTAMCQALVVVGEPQEALKLSRKLDPDWLHEHASTVLYNQFLLAAVRCKDSDGKHHHRGKKKPNQKPKETSLQTATRIFEQMLTTQKAQPDDFTYATYLMSLEKHGDWNRVLDLFATMLDTQARNAKAAESEHAKPLINALTCSTVIRALHRRFDADQAEASESQGASELQPKKPSRKISSEQRKLKQDLQIVLKQLDQIDLSNIGHASTIVDTLDEFKLFTPARQVFQRMLDEGVIAETPWREKDGFEIDLHTMSRGVAKCAVVSAFEDITRTIKEGLTNAPMQNLRIITGVGNRSQEFQKSVLKEEITDMLKNSCRPMLWPSTHPTNQGILVLRHNRLRKWVENGGCMRYF